MASRETRSNIWFYVMIAVGAMVAVTIIGVWQTLDLQCPGGERQLVIAHIPPQYQCKAVY